MSRWIIDEVVIFHKAICGIFVDEVIISWFHVYWGIYIVKAGYHLSLSKFSVESKGKVRGGHVLCLNANTEKYDLPFHSVTERSHMVTSTCRRLGCVSSRGLARWSGSIPCHCGRRDVLRMFSNLPLLLWCRIKMANLIPGSFSTRSTLVPRGMFVNVLKNLLFSSAGGGGGVSC